MRNKIIYLLTCLLMCHSIVVAGEEKTQAKEALILSHVDYAKASIDERMQKLKQKIRVIENQLWNLEMSTDEVDCDLNDIKQFRIKSQKKIKKYEDKIDALKLIKLSLDTIPLNTLL